MGKHGKCSNSKNDCDRGPLLRVPFRMGAQNTSRPSRTPRIAMQKIGAVFAVIRDHNELTNDGPQRGPWFGNYGIL